MLVGDLVNQLRERPKCACVELLHHNVTAGSCSLDSAASDLTRRWTRLNTSTAANASNFGRSCWQIRQHKMAHAISEGFCRPGRLERNLECNRPCGISSALSDLELGRYYRSTATQVERRNMQLAAISVDAVLSRQCSHLHASCSLPAASLPSTFACGSLRAMNRNLRLPTCRLLSAKGLSRPKYRYCT